jgi:hypothetical protein
LYQKQPRWLVGVVYPVVLSFLGLVILRFSDKWSDIAQVIALGCWFIVALSTGILAAANDGSLKKVRATAGLRGSILQHSKQCDQEKQLELLEALTRGRNKGPAFLARSARAKMKLEGNLHLINKALFHTVETQLKDCGALGNAHLNLCLLMPDELGVCKLVGRPYCTPGTSRIVPQVTNLNINDLETLARRPTR